MGSLLQMKTLGSYFLFSLSTETRILIWSMRRRRACASMASSSGPCQAPKKALKLPVCFSQCRTDDALRALHCVPTDPDDFDSDLAILTHVMSTPAKRKRAKKAPDELIPDVTWKPSASSSLGRKSDEVDTTLRVFSNHCSSSVEHDFEHNTSVVGYLTLQGDSKIIRYNPIPIVT